MMDPWDNDEGNSRAWEEPESDTTRRAALDQVLAEWDQRIGDAPAVRCPRCGRTVGAHGPGCDLAWLRLRDEPGAEPQDLAAEGGW